MPNSIRSPSLAPVARDPTDSGQAGPAEPAPSSTPSAADSVEHSLPQAGRLRIACRRLRPEAILPAYQTLGAAGMDLYSCLPPGETLTLAPLMRTLVPTGLALAIPPGFEGQVRPRSGWALKEGVTILNSPGTIDSDYRGEVRVLLINLGASAVTIAGGERIAQLVVCPVAAAQLYEVQVLDETCRGAGGFGHTGRG